MFLKVILSEIHENALGGIAKVIDRGQVVEMWLIVIALVNRMKITIENVKELLKGWSITIAAIVFKLIILLYFEEPNYVIVYPICIATVGSY